MYMYVYICIHGEDLTNHERSKIADVLQSRTCNEGDKIIKQGDKGSEFFILEDIMQTCIEGEMMR